MDSQETSLSTTKEDQSEFFYEQCISISIAYASLERRISHSVSRIIFSKAGSSYFSERRRKRTIAYASLEHCISHSGSRSTLKMHIANLSWSSVSV